MEEARRHVRAVMERSGTSFSLGMKILPAERREAMFAVYAFCREVDDIADEPGSVEEKLSGLATWRREVDALYRGDPGRATTRALAGPVHRYALPREEFLAIIDGMEMDARESLCAPDMETLRLYCRRVAGAVGMLSIRIFGATEPAAEDFALRLGEALQLTNILRDLDEDAERGRLYLPAELLAKHGVDTRDPETVLAHPALPKVCADLAAVARQRFYDADEALARCDRHNLRPALLMMGIYDDTLDRLTARGWQERSGSLRRGKIGKLWAAVRRGLLRPRWQPST